MTESAGSSADKPSDGSADKPETPTRPPETPPPPAHWPAGGGYPPPAYPNAQVPYPGGYPPPPWQPYPGYSPPPATPKNGLGIASLVIAIVALMLVWSVLGGVLVGATAAVIGLVARRRVTRGEATNGGVAVAGVVLGVLAIVVGLIFVAIWMGLWREAGGGDYLTCLQKAGSDPVKQQRCVDRFREHIQEKFSITPAPAPSR
ncbi:DUF4190 domain-containing protein [Mycobacterium sp. SM1]|uniref:DUF4190 domain-containing protein n=1 Tax=Mycobacterium sp. SM1 TaxID=2816243 RepID=UPI001BCF95E4|nr:DUF4190 domain-containing protein [Mycobacterium sp. SM1]MBS4729620.1 DUF4190 domain-containing protein [Mycobacterium sp. SM1]